MRPPCSTPPEDLLALAGGELDSARKEAVESHLRGCAECGRTAALFARVDATVRAGTPPIGDPALLRSITSQLAATRERDAASRPFSGPETRMRQRTSGGRTTHVPSGSRRAARMLGLGAFAAAVLVLVAGLAFILPRMRPAPPTVAGNIAATPTAPSRAPVAPSPTTGPKPTARPTERAATATASPTATAAPLSPTPTPTSAPTEAPTGDGCPPPTKGQLGYFGPDSGDTKLTFDQWSTNPQYAFIATVDGVGTSRWNTDSGCWENWNEVGVILYKPLDILTERVIVDRIQVPDNARYGVYDERLGDIGVWGAADPPRIVQGKRYIFFAHTTLEKNEAAGEDPTRETKRLMVLDGAYEVDAEGRVLVAENERIPLARAIQRVRDNASYVAVGGDCKSKPERVTVENRTFGPITLTEIGGSHGGTGEIDLKAHPPVRLDVKIDPDKEYTFIPEREMFHDQAEYEALHVTTSFGSVAALCLENFGGNTIQRGQEIEVPKLVSVRFKLTLKGAVPQGESFGLSVSENHSDDIDVGGLCNYADADRPCAGKGAVFTARRRQYLASTAAEPRIISYGIWRDSGEEGGNEIVRTGELELTEDTVIEAEYEYPR